MIETLWTIPGSKSFSDMFQTGTLREILTERVFEPLYGARELHCSKKGFTFHRPTASTCQNNSNGSTTNTYKNKRSTVLGAEQNRRVCGKVQTLFMGEHYVCVQSNGWWPSRISTRGPMVVFSVGRVRTVAVTPS